MRKKTIDLQVKRPRGWHKITAKYVFSLSLFFGLLIAANAHSQDQAAVQGDDQLLNNEASTLLKKIKPDEFKESVLGVIDNDMREAINIYRDPFQMTGSTASQVSSIDDSVSQSLTQFRLSPRGQVVPRLTLRGIIIKSGLSSPLALLEISGHGVFMVREEDEISYNAASPKDVLKIKKIRRLSVIVEAGTVGDLIVVR